MPTATKITPAQTKRLLEWMQREQPKAFTGLVRRFTPKEQLSGIWDSISNIASGVVNSVTNFVNSQGAQSLLTAATPFLQTKLEKQQLELNIKRMQSGMAPQAYVPAYAPGAYPAGTTYPPPGTYPGTTYPGTTVPPGTTYPPGTPLPPGYPLPYEQQKPIPWGWIAGAAGVGFLLMQNSSSPRRR